MTLTAGSTLQSDKYVIQETLHQSDFSITYRAIHTYLEQAVIIQGFNDCLREHHRFEQLRQLFIAEVRRRAAMENSDTMQVLDAFEEAGMPFVVVAIAVNQPLPRMRDWLPLTKLITTEPTQSQPTLPDQPNVVSEPVVMIEPESVVAAESTHSVNGMGVNRSSHEALANGPTTSPPMITASEIIASESHELLSMNGKTTPSQPVLANALSNSKSVLLEKPKTLVLVSSDPKSKAQKSKRSPQSSSFPNRLLPIALIFTALVGGLGGASAGWVLRFGHASEASPTSNEGNAPLFNFGKEQSFPPVQDWPVTHTSDGLPSDFSSQEEWEPSNAIAPTRRDRIQYNRVPEPSALEDPAYEPSELNPEPTLEEPPKEIDPTRPEFESPAKQPPALEPSLDTAPPQPPEPVQPVLPDPGANNSAPPASSGEPVSTLDSPDVVQ